VRSTGISLVGSLAAWLPGQRWFAGKGTPVTAVTIERDTPLLAGDPGLRHLLVRVTQAGHSDRYQVLAGFRRELPGRLAHAVIGPDGEGSTAYDGLHDPELTRVLLAAIVAGRVIGPLRFIPEPGARIDPGLESMVLTAEQSNTSLLFGEQAILKLFRRPAPGPNPDLELPRALTRLGSPHVAPLLGWIETDLAGAPAVLGILASYLRATADGWSMAATSVRDLYAAGTERAAAAGGDFAGEASRLGTVTAEVHRDLAAAFGTEPLAPGALRELSGQMLARLAKTTAVVPELARYAGRLSAVFAHVASLDSPGQAQRIHGDYHLGQVLRTQTGWVVLDFEGEPEVPLEQRRARSLALRDVAGMLRSFDYAARSQLASRPPGERPVAAARDWVRRNTAAFCAGYARGGGTDPVRHAALLRALALDKAVYEVGYEARNRPGWLAVPLSAIADGGAAEVPGGDQEEGQPGQGREPRQGSGPRPGREPRPGGERA
jgi:maltokinase